MLKKHCNVDLSKSLRKVRYLMPVWSGPCSLISTQSWSTTRKMDLKESDVFHRAWSIWFPPSNHRFSVGQAFGMISISGLSVCHFNKSPPGQNGRHFADDIFWCIFSNEKSCILVKISLKFVTNGLIDNNPALVQIIAWRRIGDEPLSYLMLTRFTGAYMRH